MYEWEIAVFTNLGLVYNVHYFLMVKHMRMQHPKEDSDSSSDSDSEYLH